MDPLSISVSILAIIGATVSTIKTTKSIYHASEEIDSLLNDLSEAEITIRDIQSSLGDGSIGPQTAVESSFYNQLKESERNVLELKFIIENELKGSKSFPSSRRIAWLRAKRKTKSLRKKLTEVHSDLPRRLG